jgi:hypothetical protein
MRLKEAKEAFEEATTSLHQDGKMYLTKEWDVWRKNREAENHSGSGARGSDTGKGRGSDRGRGRGGSSSSGPSTKPTGDECRHYDKMGHWAHECHSKPKKEQAHVAQDEEEASLMVTTTTLIPSEVGRTEAGGPIVPAREVRLPGESSAGTSTQGSMAEVISSSAEVEIHEENVFTHLDEEKERDVRTWILDTGATNHMSE